MSIFEKIFFTWLALYIPVGLYYLIAFFPFNENRPLKKFCEIYLTLTGIIIFIMYLILIIKGIWFS